MMLENMRKGAAKVVGSILAALLIVAMAAWGIEDYFRPGQEGGSLAYIGDYEITTREFEREFREAVDRLRRTLGPTVDAERARQLGIADVALEGIIDRQLVAMEAQRLGLVVGDDTILAQIRQNDAFKNVSGEFDRAIFQQSLNNLGMSEGQFVATMRGQLTRGFLIQAVSAGSVAPKQLTADLYRYSGQTRTAVVAVVPRSSVGDVGKPTDGQLADYHKTHAATFTAPEYRNVSAIVLDPVEYAKELKPSDDKIKEEYENRLSSLIVPERRKLQQFVVSEEEKAKKASDLLKQGKKFAEVAKEIAGTEESALSLGSMTKAEVSGLAPALGDAAFALKKGDASAPVKSPLGWHIIRVEDIQAGKTPTLDEVRDQIVRDLSRDQAIEQLVEVANKVEDALAGGATMEEAAQAVAIPLRKFGPLDRQGRGDDSKAIAALPKDRKFLQAVYEIADGEVGQMEETENGGFFIARVDKITLPALRPLDKIRADVEAAWKRAEQNKAASKRAKEVLDTVNGGTDLTKAAKDAKFTATTISAVSRRGDQKGNFPSALLQDLFRLKPGGAAMGPSPEGFAVVQLKEIKDPDQSADKAQIEQFQTNLARTLGSDLVEQFSRALRDRFDVSIDREALDAYLDRYAAR